MLNNSKTIFQFIRQTDQREMTSQEALTSYFNCKRIQVNKVSGEEYRNQMFNWLILYLCQKQIWQDLMVCFCSLICIYCITRYFFTWLENETTVVIFIILWDNIAFGFWVPTDAMMDSRFEMGPFIFSTNHNQVWKLLSQIRTLWSFFSLQMGRVKEN